MRPQLRPNAILLLLLLLLLLLRNNAFPGHKGGGLLPADCFDPTNGRLGHANGMDDISSTYFK